MPAPEPAGVIPLQDLTPDLYPFAGGKAANCARLRRAGFPVPGGLVVLSTASESDVAATSTHAWFSGLPSTCTFAVRSSGLDEDGEGESFAGVHRTVLNVSRDEMGRPSPRAGHRRTNRRPSSTVAGEASAQTRRRWACSCSTWSTR